jgi:hypothetical protein
MKRIFWPVVALTFLVVVLGSSVPGGRVAYGKITFAAPDGDEDGPPSEPEANPNTKPAPSPPPRSNAGAKSSGNTSADLFLKCELYVQCFGIETHLPCPRDPPENRGQSFKVDPRNNTVTDLGSGDVGSIEVFSTEEIMGLIGDDNLGTKIYINRITGQVTTHEAMMNVIMWIGKGTCTKFDTRKF